MTAVILFSLVWLALVIKGLTDSPRGMRRPAAWDRERDRDCARADADLYAHDPGQPR